MSQFFLPIRLVIKSLFVCFPIIISAQTSSEIFKISYEHYENGKKSNTNQSIFYHDQIVFLSKPDDKIQHYTDLEKNQNISTIKFENKTFKNVTPFSSLPVPKYDNETQDILDYDCKHAYFSYFSNRIDVWYTEETKAKGSPYSKYLPNKNALVLKIVVNGNRSIIANAINKEKDYVPFNNFSDNNVLQVNKAEFEEIKINSRYNRLQIFENETINFDPKLSLPLEKELQTDQTYHFSKGSVVIKKIRLTPELMNSEYIFAKLSCKSNGDAYDRTGSVFIIPSKKDGRISMLDAFLHGLDRLPVYKDNLGNEYQGIIKEKNYSPPAEILRFYTSFGASYFNDKRKINNYDWSENIVYKQDVSALIPINEDEFWIGVFVGNYDSGGHIINLELDFYPFMGEEENKKVTKYVEPLISTVNIMEMSGQNYGGLFANDTLEVHFEITENIKNLRLLYTSTGHGGWGGGDEFNPKLNKVFIDGKEVFKMIPWRTDCASYRLSNPASGNFGNGLSSSDLSRSNWCPGTLTPPYIIPMDMLKKGKHTLEVVIDQGENEGPSTNHWNISGVLVGELDVGDNTNKK
jgi:hypothetical protein